MSNGDPEARSTSDGGLDRAGSEGSSATSVGVTFREMGAADIPAGLALCRASGWNQTSRDWEQFLSLEPHGARVALRDGRIIGSVATVRYEDRFAWIGMVLVDPAERGRGVGTQLLRQGLEVLRDMRSVRLDATPAGHPLYIKLGLKDECGLARMERAATPEAPLPGGDGPRRMSAGDLTAVRALDREVFGADRSAMLEWLWAGAPNYGWVLGAGAGLRGYALGRHGFKFEHIGPVVAVDDDAARKLVGACLGEARGLPSILDAARSNEWLRWLESVGFREQRPFLRMCLGESGPFGIPERQFAILGPEFG